jgi:hypothetical protein
LRQGIEESVAGVRTFGGQESSTPKRNRLVSTRRLIVSWSSPHLPERSAGIGTFRIAAAVAEVSKGRSLHLSG